MKNGFSLGAFIAVNVLIDLETGAVMFFGMDRLGYPLHGFMHTLLGATVAFVAVALFEWQWRWLAGAAFGAYSHLLMDATVHSDVQPFAPLLDGNPLNMGWMEPLSLVCLVVLAWYGVPYLFITVRKAMNGLRNFATRPDERELGVFRSLLSRTQASKIFALASWVLLYVPVLLLAAIGIAFAEIRFDYGVLHEGFAPSRFSQGYAYIVVVCLLPAGLWMALVKMIR